MLSKLLLPQKVHGLRPTTKERLLLKPQSLKRLRRTLLAYSICLTQPWELPEMHKTPIRRRNSLMITVLKQRMLPLPTSSLLPLKKTDLTVFSAPLQQLYRAALIKKRKKHCGENTCTVSSETSSLVTLETSGIKSQQLTSYQIPLPQLAVKFQKFTPLMEPLSPDQMSNTTLLALPLKLSLTISPPPGKSGMPRLFTLQPSLLKPQLLMLPLMVTKEPKKVSSYTGPKPR